MYEQSENISKERETIKKNHTNSAVEEYSNWIEKFTKGAQQQTDYQAQESANLKASHLKWSSQRRKEEGEEVGEEKEQEEGKWIKPKRLMIYYQVDQYKHSGNLRKRLWRGTVGGVRVGKSLFEEIMANTSQIQGHTNSRSQKNSNQS